MHRGTASLADSVPIENQNSESRRNVAIIAHVDHGKTTLVDGLLRQTGLFRSGQEIAERVMDSGDLERERGITILSKSTQIEYEGTHISLVDTPGHADFGGEVERVLGMVDGVLLLVDAVEGVMPQTRFVVAKALEHGLRPILVINKIDRPEQRANEVLDEVFDLLVELGASDHQLDFPVVYASGANGYASLEATTPGEDLRPLLKTLIRETPPPPCDPDGPLQFQAVTLGWDTFLGRLVIGRVERGNLTRGEVVTRVTRTGKSEPFRITKLFGTEGLSRIERESARAGEIVILAGIDSIEVGDTICAKDFLDPLPRIEIDPPTIRIAFSANSSPFAGKEGQFLTSRQIGDRLDREALSNVSIQIEHTANLDQFQVAARGELQLAILMETMRREGYEFSVSRPEIIEREIDGKICEPVEDVVAEVPETLSGVVLDKLSGRRGVLKSMNTRDSRTQLTFVVPSRGLFGYRGVFLSDTRGEGLLYRTVRGYEPISAPPPRRQLGALVATDTGQATPYAIFNIQERATLFVPPGENIYKGQIVGENSRVGDMNVNLIKAKKLTNIRAAGKDDNTLITPHRSVTLERALEWLEDDELLEVTPKSIRLRKKIINSDRRKG